MGIKCRAFSPSRVVEEIDHLVNKCGTRGLYFIGDNFTINKKRTIEFCKLLKSELDIEWICDTRADLISRDLLKGMKGRWMQNYLVWCGIRVSSYFKETQ